MAKSRKKAADVSEAQVQMEKEQRGKETHHSIAIRFVLERSRRAASITT